MIVAMVPDLFFQVRIRTTAQASGRQIEFISSASDAVSRADSANLLIVDLDSGKPDPVELIREVRAKQPDLKILAFGPHVQKERFRQARSAGADQVLGRSRFSSDLVEILNAELPAQ
jgi:DNA-binding NarL/FixJ family response regulator